MKRFGSFAKRTNNIFLASLLLVTQLLFAYSPFITQKAYAAVPDICTNDVQGANDEPGQKDLTKFCEADDNEAGEITISWQWDEISWSGSNTGDACALFDTNNNNLSNYAVCVTVSGNPAVQSGVSPRIYTCNDSALEKCAGDSLVTGPYLTTCSVNQSGTDPFPGPPNKKKGAAYPNDTQAQCVIRLSEVGAGSAVLKDVCSFPSQQPNSDPSDCIITPTNNTAKYVEVVKDLNPAGSGTFSLRIDGIVKASGIGDGGSTGQIEVDGVDVDVSEVATGATSLINFTTNITCVDAADQSSAPIVNTNPTGTTSRSAEFDFPRNVDEVLCIITNTQRTGQITVVKDVINDNGGTKTYQDFTFQVDGGTPQSFDETTSPDGAKTISVPVGSTYDITEPQANQGGYSTTYNDCTDINPVAGQTQTCTITNDDIPATITLEKTVVNNDGGGAVESNFQAKLDGNNVAWDVATPVSAGGHTASETTLNGYKPGVWGGACNADGTITVQFGQNYTCTITNDDIAPTLQLIKNLTNDNGGNALAFDWFLIATNDDTDQDLINEQGTSSDEGATAATGTYDAAAGITYVLSESGLTGYSSTGTWNCTGGGTYNDTNKSITLLLAENAICTITNNDVAPTLTVVKEVVNDNGGNATVSDFSITSNGSPLSFGTGVTVGDTTTYTATPTVLSNTNYALTEADFAGYAEGTWSCTDNTTGTGRDITVNLDEGESVTCTITNNDIAPLLILKKVVINDNGGNNLANEWRLTAKAGLDTAVIDTFGTIIPDSDGLVAVTAAVPVEADVFYALTESGPDGYTASDWNCDGGRGVDNNAAFALGTTVTCTITNDDQQAYIVVDKTVTNDNGGSAAPDDFNLTVDSNAVLDEVAVPVNPGTQTVGETNLPGYTAGTWGGACAADATVTVALGETKTCTITNDDDAPSLTLVKTVTNNNGGERKASEWNLTATGSLQSPTNLEGDGGATSGADFKADTYTLDESGPSDYTEGSWSCTNDVTVNGDNQITLANGQTTTCTIDNDDIAPTLTVTKIVLNPYGNPLLASAFPLFVDSTSVTSGVPTTQFDAGSQTISETQQTGYEFTGIDGDCTLEDDIISVLLGLAGSYTCVITNTAIQPRLIVIKHVVNDNGGDKDAEDFTMTVSGNSQVVKDFPGEESPGTEILLNEGSFSVDELADDGYAKSFSGDCEGTIAIGETKTCTITNDDIAPVLTLKKVVDSVNTDHDSSDWTLTATPTEGAPISGNGDNGWDEESAGAHMTYTLSEQNDSDGTFDASDWVCKSTSEGDFTQGEGDLNNQISMNEGANVTCTITNTERGSITIIKDAQPDSSQEFKFTGSLGDPDDEEGPNFTLVDDGVGDGVGQRTFSNLIADPEHAYTVTEPNVKGWSLDSIICTTEEGVNVNNRNVVITLEPGENVTCTFVNTRDTGEITVTKITDPSPDVDEEDFTIRLRGDTESNDIIHESILSDGQSDPYEAETNDYTMNEEVIPDGWDLADAYCTRDEGETRFDPREGFTLEKDDDVACFFLNEKRAEVKVTKYNDFDRDGEKDENEPTLPDWDFNLKYEEVCDQNPEFSDRINSLLENELESECGSLDSLVTERTDENGIATFEDVLPSKNYELTEDLKPGWHVSGMDCEEVKDSRVGDSLFFSPDSGQQVVCMVGNYQETVLLLEKENDTPDATIPGDTVTYTLTVTVPENSGPSYNTTVTDLPPENFEYVEGSAVASNGGSLTKVYASPGQWSLGDLFPGESVTLTYRAVIQSIVSAGNYPDLAFAQGQDTPTDGLTIFSNQGLARTGRPFVGTAVSVLVTRPAILVNTGARWLALQLIVPVFVILGVLSLSDRQKRGAKA